MKVLVAALPDDAVHKIWEAIAHRRVFMGGRKLHRNEQYTNVKSTRAYYICTLLFGTG